MPTISAQSISPATPASLPSAPPNLSALPKAARQSLVASSYSPALPCIIPADISQALGALLPQDCPADLLTDSPAATYDRRDWLKNAPTIITPPHKEREKGAKLSVDYGTPPAVLSAVEGILWPSLGRACARSALFLYHWLLTRKYMRACELSGSQPQFITACRLGSPAFMSMYDSAESVVRTTRSARTEDTLHALANGDLRRVKTVTDAEGNVVTTDEGEIYSEKAIALELAANAPERYAPQSKSAAAVVINLVLDVPRPTAQVAASVQVQASPSPASQPEVIDFEPVEV